MDKEKKSAAEKLREELMIPKKKGALTLEDKTFQAADDFCENYKKFLNKAKTEREAVDYAVKLPKKAGFAAFDPAKTYQPGDRVYYNNRGRAAVFAVIGKKGASEGLRIAAAHIDSPRLDLKPRPLYEANDLALFKTHYYGGIKKYQWTAIPLALHGRVVRRDGSFVDISLGEKEDEPRFCVTDLLPHLAREQMGKSLAKGIEGEDLNILVGSRPFKDDKGSELVKLNIMRLINEKYGIVEADFLSAELELVPAFKACDIGFDRSMIGSYGHDDRVCAYPALMAAFGCETPEHTVLTVLADKEEVGSDGNTGLNSSFLKYFVADLAEKEGLRGRDVLSRSSCLSADVNAAFDPTYAGAYEAGNSCFLNGGVVITKYTGHGGKSDTSDASAEFMAEVRAVLDGAKVLWQTGELGKVDGGGGGTVAKYIANLNVEVVDLGVPVLSMHAPFEVVSKVDVYMAYRAFSAFFGKTQGKGAK